MSSQLDGKSKRQGTDPSVAMDTEDYVEPHVIVEQPAASPESRRKKAKQERFVEKYVLRGLEKEEFNPPMWRKVVLVGSTIFFVCFNTVAIIFEFV